MPKLTSNYPTFMYWSR